VIADREDLLPESRVRVFLSHSSKSASSREYFNSVVQAIKERSELELLVDEEGLKPGDLWKTVIYGWIEQAHAAVILLSDDALASDWVGIEAAIISFLDFQGHRFKLIPVLLSKNEDLRGKLIGKLGFRESYQCIEPVDPKDAAERVVKALCLPAFVNQVCLLSPPRMGLQAHVVNELRKIEFNELCLTRIRGDLPNWPSDPHPRTADEARHIFARQIVEADFYSACDALERLVNILNASRSDHINVISHIAEVVLPPAWIPEMDAPIVAQGAAAPPSESARRIAMSICNDWVFESLVRRSSGRPVEVTNAMLVRLSAPEYEDCLQSFKDQMRAYCETALNRVKFRVRVDLDDDRLKHRLKSFEEKKKRVFVVMEHFPLDSDFVKRFRADFETPTLLLVPSNEVASELDHSIPQLKLKADDDEKTYDYFDIFLSAIEPCNLRRV
jgi:hypothetical protein